MARLRRLNSSCYSSADDSDSEEMDATEEAIERMLDVDARVLREHYAQQNVRAGLHSEEVQNVLLTDSCINR